MKKIILLALTALMVVGCKEIPKSEPTKGCYYIYIETINGHEYIVLDGSYSGSIIHSESCPCKERRQQEIKELIKMLKEE